MKFRLTSPVLFIVVSSLVFLLALYLFATKTVNPWLLLATCTELIKSAQIYAFSYTDRVLSVLIYLLAVVSVFTASIRFIIFLRSHLRLSSNYKKTYDYPENLKWVLKKHDLKKGEVVLANENKPVAYTTGVIKSQIVISRRLTKVLSRRQLEAVVLHELHHLQSRHGLWLLLARLTSSLLFFVPVLDDLYKRLKTEMEMAADEFVVNTQKTGDHLRSALALNLQSVGNISPNFAAAPIEKRVEYLLTKKISREKIDMMRVCISITSVCIMLILGVYQPVWATSGFDESAEFVCQEKEVTCLSDGCQAEADLDSEVFTPLISAESQRFYSLDI